MTRDEKRSLAPKLNLF